MASLLLNPTAFVYNLSQHCLCYSQGGIFFRTHDPILSWQMLFYYSFYFIDKSSPLSRSFSPTTYTIYFCLRSSLSITVLKRVNSDLLLQFYSQHFQHCIFKSIPISLYWKKKVLIFLPFLSSVLESTYCTFAHHSCKDLFNHKVLQVYIKYASHVYFILFIPTGLIWIWIIF